MAASGSAEVNAGAGAGADADADADAGADASAGAGNCPGAGARFTAHVTRDTRDTSPMALAHGTGRRGAIVDDCTGSGRGTSLGMTSAVPTPITGAGAVGLPPTAFERRFGHPPGLVILFFAEMWERFSYYGMRGLLKLYMANYLFVTIRQTLQGKAYDGSGDPMLVKGWAFVEGLLPVADPLKLQECVAAKAAALVKDSVATDVAHQIAVQTCHANEHGSILYGWYTGLVYLTPLLGGYIADKYLGQRKTVVVGGVLMAIGHFVMAFENSFFIALVLLILGNGAFKPNVSTQVGSLYRPGDPRRDRAFAFFYVGINLGAFICNFVCGTLAAVWGWHYGFAAAGVGMVCGLITYVSLGPKYLAPDTLMKKKAAEKARGAEAAAETKAATPAEPHKPFTKDEWARIWALI